ncbi:MAG: FixH family protein [Dissulfurimicrobium sp.]
MKNVIIWVIVLLFVGGAAYAADGAMKQKVDDYTVAIAFEKMPPHVGDNTLKITVTDPSGKPLTNPVVRLRAYMQEEKITQKVEKMAYMVAPVDLEHKGSSCVATVEFTMQGRWIVDVAAANGNKHINTSFDIDVK